MKKFLLLLLVPFLMLGQTTTHIHDVLFNPSDTVTSGSTVSGTLKLTSNSWSVNGKKIVKTLKPITLINGVVDIDLAPNDTETNANSYYIADYAIKSSITTTSYSEKWQVPTSNSTKTITDITVNTTQNPTINPILASQIVPGSVGQCLVVLSNSPLSAGWGQCPGGGTSTTYTPNWQQVSGLPSGSWAYNYNQKGEHSVLHNGMLYVPLEDVAYPYTNSGLGQIDPATGQLLNFVSIPTSCMESAPVFDNSGNVYTYSCASSTGSNGSFISKINLTTWTVSSTISSPSINNPDTEAITYDSVNNNLIILASNGISAIKTSDFSTVWTNTDVNYTCGGCSPQTTGPILLHSGFVYWRDLAGVVWKINATTGTTVASQNTFTTSYNSSYSQLSYDSVNDRLFGTNLTNVAFALHASDLSVIWSQTVDTTSFRFFRGGAYNNNVYYATDRQTSGLFASKIYAFDAATGNILWTNTTALDNEAQISGLIVDDTYVYATTHGHDTHYFYNILVINRADGTFVEKQQLLHDVSSSIPAAYGGKIIVGLWDNFGYEAVKLRTGGSTSNDWYYKADTDMTGYAGTAMSGDLTTLSTTYNTAPSGGVLVVAPNAVNQVSHMVMGTCSSNPIAMFVPCKLKMDDLGSSPVAGYVLKAISDGKGKFDGIWQANTPTPGGTSGQIQYNSSGSLGGFTPQVNGVNIVTPNTMNFQSSNVFNGLTFTFTNPSGGNIQLGATGTLDNSGLTNNTFGITYPSWLTGASTVSLGGTLGITAASGQTPHRVLGTCGSAVSVSLCALVAADIPTLNYQATLGYTPENVTNKSTLTTLGTSDSLYPSQNAVKTYVDSGLSGKQNTLGFTAENIVNKDTNTSLGTSNTSYPSQLAVKTYVDTGLSGKQNSLGFTPEDIGNKSINTALGASDTLYPSQNAVKTYVDAGLSGKQNSLGFTPENVANKNATSGYAGLSAGLLNPAQIPLPSATTLGGVKSITCTNQVLTALSTLGALNCTPVTSAMVDTSIAKTGVDINTSNQVTQTHLAAGLPRAQGGLNSASAGTGFLRDGTTPTAGELSGDCTTSSSFAINCTKTNGTPFGSAATTNTGTSGATIPLLNANNTYSGNSIYTGQTDASGATHTTPAKTGLIASKPATCAVGEEYFATDAIAGQNKYYCTATNTWTHQSGGGGGTTLSSLYTLQSGNYFYPLFQASGLPDAATWAWLYQPSGVTVSSASHGLTMYDPFVGASNVTTLAAYEDTTALASGAFVLKSAIMNPLMLVSNPPDKTSSGICITDGTKVVTYGVASFFGSPSIGTENWSSQTSSAGVSNRITVNPPFMLWLRITLASGTLSFDFSVDGGNSYVNSGTQGVSSFLAAGSLYGCIATSTVSSATDVSGLTLVDWSH